MLCILYGFSFCLNGEIVYKIFMLCWYVWENVIVRREDVFGDVK